MPCPERCASVGLANPSALKDQMPDEDLIDCQAFLEEYVTSYEQLEVLLLLRREQPRALEPAQIAAQLRLSQPMVQAALDHLVSLKMLEATTGEAPGFRSRPLTAKADAQLQRIAEIYEVAPPRLMKVINRQAIERVRAKAAQAFKLRKKLDGGE